MRPKVSIIVPVYKTEETLQECVDSLLKQSLESVEIILVDDGSPDESGSMCDRYLFDRRVKVIHKENGGLSSARNAGLEVVTGDYIAFLDSDDYVSIDMYEKLYNKIISTGADVCMCAHYTINSHGEKVPHFFRDMPEIIEDSEILNKLILPLIGPDLKRGMPEVEGFVSRNLYKRQLLEDTLFLSEREYFAEDVVFNLNVYKKCKKICVINECLFYYRYNPASLSNDYRKNVSCMLERLLQWEMDYMTENEIDEHEYRRLYATGVKFVLFSIHNLKKKNCELTKREKKQEMKAMFNKRMFQMSLKKCRVLEYNYKMQVFIILCKLRCYNLLLRFV